MSEAFGQPTVPGLDTTKIYQQDQGPGPWTPSAQPMNPIDLEIAQLMAVGHPGLSLGGYEGRAYEDRLQTLQSERMQQVKIEDMLASQEMARGRAGAAAAGRPKEASPTNILSLAKAYADDEGLSMDAALTKAKAYYAGGAAGGPPTPTPDKVPPVTETEKADYTPAGLSLLTQAGGGTPVEGRIAAEQRSAEISMGMLPADRDYLGAKAGGLFTNNDSYSKDSGVYLDWKTGKDAAEEPALTLDPTGIPPLGQLVGADFFSAVDRLEQQRRMGERGTSPVEPQLAAHIFKLWDIMTWGKTDIPASRMGTDEMSPFGTQIPMQPHSVKDTYDFIVSAFSRSLRRPGADEKIMLFDAWLRELVGISKGNPASRSLMEDYMMMFEKYSPTMLNSQGR